MVKVNFNTFKNFMLFIQNVTKYKVIEIIKNKWLVYMYVCIVQNYSNHMFLFYKNVTKHLTHLYYKYNQ